MSFTRAAYDQCAYKTDIKQSIGPGAYHLTRPLSDRTCMQQIPELGAGAGGHRYDSASLVDVDSELIGISRKFTKCRAPIADVPHKDTIIFADCGTDTAGESTRLTNCPGTLRDNGVNRFTPLCFDPQRNFELPFQARTNQRIIVKDNHRPCIERPLDPSESLPPGAGDIDPATPNEYAMPEDIAQYHYNPPSSIIAPCNSVYSKRSYLRAQ